MSSPPRSRGGFGTWTALLVWTLVVCPVAAWLFWQRVVESDALFFILPGLLAAVGSVAARRSVAQTIGLSILAVAATMLSLLVLIAWLGSNGAFE